MNIQAILDATATIAGGAVTSQAHVFKGAGGIAGVRIAFSDPPDTLAEDDLAHVSIWDGTEVDPDGPAAGDLTTFRHSIRMQLCLDVARSELPKAYRILTPYAPLYVTAFAAKSKLNLTCSVARLQRSPGIVESIYPDRVCMEWTLIATEKEAITYVAA